MKDLHLLSRKRLKTEKFPGTAIICGGSISGLFSARVCANHFEKVIIVEPEEWVAVGEQGLQDHHRESNAPKRSRVAQYTSYHHFHTLITSGMKEMFSTFEEEIRRTGGRITHCFDNLWVSGIQKLTPSKFPVYYGGIYARLLSISRPGFETTLRRLVLQTCNEVQYFHGSVTGLLYDETLNRVSGVNVKLQNGETVELEGSLVVDATGSFMGGHRWLKAIPKFAGRMDDIRISFNPKVTYVLAEFALPPALEEDFRQYGLPTGDDQTCVLYASLPLNASNDKSFSIDKREKNFLHINCGGYGWSGDIQTVSDIEDFVKNLDLKRPLPQWIHDMLHILQSHDVPVSFEACKYPHSVYIKYHELKDIPSNFVVVGDAQSQTDPILGQGCSKAFAVATILNYHLHKSSPNAVGLLPPSFAKQYFLDVKTRTEFIWDNLKYVDYNFPSTIPLPGEDPKTTAQFARKFSDIFIALTTKDAELSGVFHRHVVWIEPPTAIMAPWIIRRVAWAWIKSLLGYELL